MAGYNDVHLLVNRYALLVILFQCWQRLVYIFLKVLSTCSPITCLNFKENIYGLTSWRHFFILSEITVINIYFLASLCLNCYFSLRKCRNYILKLILFCCSHIHWLRPLESLVGDCNFLDGRLQASFWL